MHTHLHPDYLDLAVRLMDQNDIEMMIDITPNIGDDLKDLITRMQQYPGRFAAFAGVDFSGFGDDGWIQRECDALRRSADLGAVGLKFWKELGLSHRDTAGEIIRVDDERIAPIIDLAGELGLVVAYHIADPKAFFRPLNPSNERWEELSLNPGWWFGDRQKYPYGWWQLIRQLERVIRRHPNTTIMGVHFGCAAEEIEYVCDVMRDYPNYIVDVAARLGEIGRHEASLVRELFIEFQDRILFGTDLGVRQTIMLGAPQDFSPTEQDVQAFYEAHWRFFETAETGIDHPTPIQGRWTVDAIDLPDYVLPKFYHQNTERYLLRRF